MKIKQLTQIVAVILLSIVLYSCGGKSNGKTDPLTQSQVMKTLEMGSKLVSMSKDGTHVSDFSKMLDDTKGSIELTLVMLPKNWDTKIRINLVEARDSWSFAKYFWDIANSPELLTYGFLYDGHCSTNENLPFNADYGGKVGDSPVEARWMNMSKDFRRAIPLKFTGSTISDKKEEYAYHLTFKQIPDILAYSASAFESAREAILDELKK